MRYEMILPLILNKVSEADKDTHENGPIQFAAHEGLRIAIAKIASGQNRFAIGNVEDEIVKKLDEFVVREERLAILLGLDPDLAFRLDWALMDILIRGRALMSSDVLFQRALGIAGAIHTAISFAVQVDAKLAKGLQDCHHLFVKTSMDRSFNREFKTVFERLRAITLERRGIGLEWRFSDQEKALLAQYEIANLLVLECMNAAEGLTTEVRQRIEMGMLLPFDEIPAFSAW